MTHITEHHAKEEGEGDDTDCRRVCFLIFGYSICVYNQLKYFGTLIGLNVRGSSDIMIFI